MSAFQLNGKNCSAATVIENVQVMPSQIDTYHNAPPILQAAQAQSVKTDMICENLIQTIDENANSTLDLELLNSSPIFGQDKQYILTTDGQILQLSDQIAGTSVVTENSMENDLLSSTTDKYLADLLSHVKEIGNQQRTLTIEFKHVTKKVDEMYEHFIGQERHMKKSQVAHQPIEFQKINTVENAMDLEELLRDEDYAIKLVCLSVYV